MSHLRRGWYWGSQEFAQRLLKFGEVALGKKRHRNQGYVPEKQAHDEAEAERLLTRGLAAAGFEEGELERVVGADIRKVALATWLWGRTTVSQDWLAERLKMSPSSLRQIVSPDAT